MKRIRLDEPKSSGGGAYFTTALSPARFINSGCNLLDRALGGGWAENRISNVVGDKSTGKTLLMIESAANFARKYPKGIIDYRESESAFDKSYAQALGMPLDRVDFGQPLETIEDWFNDLSSVIAKAKQPHLYILDSLDALSDAAEMAREITEGSYGANKAKQSSQLFRRLTSQLADSKVTVIIVSQVRSKIGVSFGRHTTRSGGRALDFYASQVLYLQHVSTITKTVKGQKRAIGIDIKAKVDKNKVALPFREAAFTIKFGYGIDDAKADLMWLKDVKHLKDIRLPEKEIEGYLRDLEDMTADEYTKELTDLHEAVNTRWFEIEDTLIPKRRKYT